MKFVALPAALLAGILWQAAPANQPPVAQPDAMRYQRALAVPAGPGQACAVLDAQIFPHAAPSLTDLRVFPTPFANPHEIPYAITLSEAATEETTPARVLNLGTDRSGKKIVFDLEMPARAYTDVALDLDPALHDFLATAAVTGSDTLGADAKSTALGSFTLFDLTSQRLSRDTTLPLQESTFRYLHVVLNVSPAPGTSESPQFVPAMVEGAQVPPSREAQAVYTVIAETASVATSGRESHASFVVPERVPIERVSFQFAPGFKANFSRDVRVTATSQLAAKSTDQPAASAPNPQEDDRAPIPEVVTGTILRVHTTQTGREIHTEQLGIPAILGANLQRPAKIEVAVENGDDQPLPIASVRLEMRERRLCFDASAAANSAPANSAPALFYGDPKLVAPVYDYDRLFVASAKPIVAQLGPEMPNPNYHPTADNRPFTERHPEVLWIALIVVISALGTVALKSARNVGA